MINIGIILGMAARTAQGRTAITNLATGLLTFAEARSELAAAAAAAPIEAPPAPAPPAPAPAKPTFPEGYTTLADELKEIETKYASKITAASNLITKAAAALDMYKYMTTSVPGILVHPHYKSVQLEKLTNLIDELTKALASAPPAQQLQIKLYLSELSRQQWHMNTDKSIKFSWHTADGFRITIVQTYEGFREVRRGDLTGKDLKKAGVMTWKSADELIQYWTDNNISTSDVATAYGGY